MKPLPALLIALLVLVTQGRSESLALPREQASAVERMSHIQNIGLVKELPEPVSKLCQNGHLAEPGQNWSATDAIVDLSLPGARLIWAVTAGDYYIVHYETGGIAHLYHVLVARWTRGQDAPSFTWTGMGGRLEDFAAFQAAVGRSGAGRRRDFGY